MIARAPNTHPSYEDSTIRWIGAYPNSWALTRVKFESYVKARVGWHGLKSDDFTDEGPYLVTGTDFSDSRVNWPDCHHCDERRYDQDPYIQLREGDLLVTKDGTIGKLALVEELDGKATLNSGVFVVRPLTTRYISRFYFWLLQSSVFHGFVEYRKTGSTIVHLYQETFENFSFAMPPVAEQSQIAKFLDYETAKIDGLIEKQQQLIALLKEKRQAVISHAVTKGLNPDAPMRDSGVEWLGEVPVHWTVAKLKFFASMRGGFAFSSDEYLDDGVQILKIGNLYQSRLDLARAPTFVGDHLLSALPEFSVREGDVLMSLTGTLGKRDYGFAVQVEVPGPFLLNQRVANVSPAPGRVTSRYLVCALRSEPYLAQLYALPSGTKQANLSNADVLNIPVAVPPSLEEQEKVASNLHTQTQRIDETIERATEAVGLLQERRAALIYAAVTGKIDVRGWRAFDAEPEAEVA